MKKIRFIVLLFFMAIALAACNDKEPTPDERFTEYVKLWNEQKFEKMYDYLSVPAKESIKKDEFVEKYSKIYGDLEIADLKVEFTAPKEELEKDAEQVRYPFSVEMNSLAGGINFDLQAEWIKEEDEDNSVWRLNWDTSFIFPDLEEGDKISVPKESPERGRILDRNGIALAENGVARQIGLVPGQMEGKEAEIIQQVSDILGVEKETIENSLKQDWVQADSFVPVKTVPEDAMELREKVGQVQAVLGKDVPARVYPLGERAGHLTGNIAPVTAEDLEKHEGKGYSQNDLIGRRGLELVLEDRLRGEPGVKIVITKEDGSEVVLAQKDVKNGEDVQLTIDSTVQVTMYDQIKDQPGTAVALNPQTGETLALVSTPSYDPNVLTLGPTNEQWKELEEHPDHPMLNRFNAVFAPGSVIKPLTAAIGLDAGAIDWEKAFTIDGLTWRKDDSWGNYAVKRVSDPGTPVNLDKALIYSDNIYFAMAGLEIGEEPFKDGLRTFGFEEDVPYLYPLHQSTYGDIDSDIALADSSYGQGQVEMSIVHLASTYTPFINKGNMIKPILELNEENGEIWKEQVVSEEQASKVSTALRQVVENPNGTAKAAAIPGYPLAGKTGTAEYAKAEQGTKGKENGYFVAYNPENPELLVALMVEGQSSKVAVQAVKDIFIEWKK